MSGQPGGAVPGTVPFEDSLTSPTHSHPRHNNLDGTIYSTTPHQFKSEKKGGTDGDDEKVEVIIADIDPVIERRVLWKIDRNILILFFLIYGMQYLDKVFPFSSTKLRSLTLDFYFSFQDRIELCGYLWVEEGSQVGRSGLLVCRSLAAPSWTHYSTVSADG